MTPQPQHLRALDQANRIRLARAAIKRKLATGADPTPYLLEPTEELANMTIMELLRSQQRWGRTRTRQFLVPLAIAENRPLKRLTDRQRAAVAEALVETRDRKAKAADARARKQAA